MESRAAGRVGGEANRFREPSMGLGVSTCMARKRESSGEGQAERGRQRVTGTHRRDEPTYDKDTATRPSQGHVSARKEDDGNGKQRPSQRPVAQRPRAATLTIRSNLSQTATAAKEARRRWRWNGATK